MDAEEAVGATAAAAKDSEGVLEKEAAAVKAEAEAGSAAPGLAKAEPEATDVKPEANGTAAASDRAGSEQDASTSGRDTVPGMLPLDSYCVVHDLSFLPWRYQVGMSERSGYQCGPSVFCQRSRRVSRDV